MKNWGKYLWPLLIILLALVLAQSLFKTNRFRPEISAESFSQKTKDLKSDDFDAIFIRDNQGSLDLKKENGSWRLKERLVEEAKIANLYRLLFDDASNFEEISEKPDRYPEFGLASPAAKQLIFKTNGQEKLNLWLGKFSYPGNFIRLEPGPTVYLTGQNLEALTDTNPNSFWDKKVVRFAETDLVKLTVVRGKQTFALSKNLISNLILLKGDKILEDRTEKKKYPTLLGTLMVETADGQKETFKFYKGQNESLVERQSDGELLTLPTLTAESFLTEP